MTWKNEPQRHALASEGVKTSFGKLQKIHRNTPPKELYDINWNKAGAIWTSERNMTKVIKLFWWCSINNRWDYFLVDDFLSNFKYTMYDIMDEYVKEYDMNLKVEDLDEELKEKIIKDFQGMYDEQEQKWLFKQNYELWDKLKNWKQLSKNRKIALIDEIIHLEHLGKGNYWELDIPQLREQFEEEYL